MTGRNVGKKNPFFGKTHTPEVRERIRKALSGRRLSKKHKDNISKGQIGRIGGMKGKKHKPSTIQKMKNAHKGKHVGELNNSWKGGITPINKIIRSSEEYSLWRNAVFKRDNYTCIWCGQLRGNIETDHIKPFSIYPELRFAIDNGRTLCHNCHTKTYTYGNRKKNRD